VECPTCKTLTLKSSSILIRGLWYCKPDCITSVPERKQVKNNKEADDDSWEDEELNEENFEL